MPTITLPDGKNLKFSKKVTGLQVAEEISKSLAKQAMVISINGELKDLDFLIESDCSVKIFTAKNNEGLETIRIPAGYARLELNKPVAKRAKKCQPASPTFCQVQSLVSHHHVASRARTLLQSPFEFGLGAAGNAHLSVHYTKTFCSAARSHR